MNSKVMPLLLAALAVPLGAQAAEQLSPRIAVTGEGEVALAPDTAIVVLSVLREAETAREALDENNAAAAQVIEALKEAGVADRDLQTSGLSINPRYVYPQNGEDRQPRLVAYQVSNTLTARIRDLDQVGAVIDRSVTLGVNQGGSISFVNDDPGEALTEARRLAVADAQERARTLAEAAGVRIGRVLDISEHGPVSPPVPIGARMMRAEAASDAVPIEAGENTYRIRVSVTFELDQ